MEFNHKPCEYLLAIFVMLAGIILGIVSAILFAFGFLPTITNIFLFTAILGFVIAIKVFNLSGACSRGKEFCLRSLGFLTLFQAILLTVSSIIAMTFIFSPVSLIIIFYFLIYASSFWITLLGFIALYRCLMDDCERLE